VGPGHCNSLRNLTPGNVEWQKKSNTNNDNLGINKTFIEKKTWNENKNSVVQFLEHDCKK